MRGIALRLTLLAAMALGATPAVAQSVCPGRISAQAFSPVPRDAAIAVPLLHAAAGDAAARDDGERGLLPSDLLPWLRRLANPVRR